MLPAPGRLLNIRYQVFAPPRYLLALLRDAAPADRLIPGAGVWIGPPVMQCHNAGLNDIQGTEQAPDLNLAAQSGLLIDRLVSLTRACEHPRVELSSPTRIPRNPALEGRILFNLKGGFRACRASRPAGGQRRGQGQCGPVTDSRESVNLRTTIPIPGFRTGTLNNDGYLAWITGLDNYEGANRTLHVVRGLAPADALQVVGARQAVITPCRLPARQPDNGTSLVEAFLASFNRMTTAPTERHGPTPPGMPAE